MKVGIRKVHEDEWWVEAGCATVRLTYFQVELLNIVLQEAVRLSEGGEYDLLTGFIKLAHKLDLLSDEDLQKVLRAVDDRDLALLLRTLKEGDFRSRVLRNVGPLLAKQLEQDLNAQAPLDVDAAKGAIERIMRTAFAMEARGEIEFQTTVTEYI